MILEISNGTDKVAVEIATGGGKKTIRLGGRDILCDWVPLGDGQYSLIVDGSVHDIHVNLNPETCVVTSRAGTYTFQVSDPRRASRQQENGQSGVLRICADMPGKVVRVNVQAGDSIQTEQSLLVLEAMKMQNDIRAPKAGTVKEVSARAGGTVNTGDFLLSIES